MSGPNVFYAQSGGVTAVINASACGVIEAARSTSKIGKVFVGKNGILGALTEELIDTSKESKRDIAMLRHTPSGAFGSCRFKLKPLKMNLENMNGSWQFSKPTALVIFFTTVAGTLKIRQIKSLRLAEGRVIPFNVSVFPRRSITIFLLPILALGSVQSLNMSPLQQKKPAWTLRQWPPHQRRFLCLRSWVGTRAGLLPRRLWLNKALHRRPI